jgi:hypothetical protein
MRAALLAIALTLGLAAPAGTGSDAPPPAAHGGAQEPDGVLVLAVLSPERILVADPRTGRTRERVLPGGTHCHGPLLVTGDRVVYFGLRRRLMARAAPLGRLGDDRPIGSAEIAVPSATPGRLWLGDRRGGRVELREVDLAGVVRARASTPVARWGTVQARVGGEFLMTHGTGLVLGSERFRGAWLVAAAPDRFAWCGDPCPRVGIWSGGSRGVLEPPPGVRPQVGPAGAFSPDGTRLGLPVTVAGKARFAVVELAHNEWRIVPKARPGDYSALAWSPSGDWLYLAARGDRLLASRGGTQIPRPLPIRTRGTVMSITTATAAGRTPPAARPRAR